MIEIKAAVARANPAQNATNRAISIMVLLEQLQLDGRSRLVSGLIGSPSKLSLGLDPLGWGAEVLEKIGEI
jgi:hypothetical protein